MLDTATIRPQFPILETSVHGKPLIYLDNAATTQKPLAVLNAIRHYYDCLLYTSPSPRDSTSSRMPSSA